MINFADHQPFKNKKMKTEIRTYTPADKEQVMSLIRLNIPHYFAPEEEDDFSDYLDHKRDLYYVLLCGDAIIGCGGINFDEEEAVGKISWDIIHPGYQRRGLGTLLLQYRMDKLKSIESIRKITVRTSQFVYPFYQKNGFVLLKTEKDFSAKGFDLYQMEYITKCSTHITDRKHNMQDLDTFLPTANRKSIIMNKAILIFNNIN